MEVRATLTLHNNAMIKARKKHGLNQADAALLAGVSLQYYATIEKMEYNCSYIESKILSIAQLLELNNEQVMTPQLAKLKLPRTFQQEYEISTERLIETCTQRERRFFIESPEKTAERNEQFEILRKMVKTLPPRERGVIELRYGLDPKAGGPYTLVEVGRIFKLSYERVRAIEAKAIKHLLGRADLLKRGLFNAGTVPDKKGYASGESISNAV